jgi:hypothetical protein
VGPVDRAPDEHADEPAGEKADERRGEQESGPVALAEGGEPAGAGEHGQRAQRRPSVVGVGRDDPHGEPEQDRGDDRPHGRRSRVGGNSAWA